MKKILLLDTSVGSLNMGDEIINDSIKRNWPDLFSENYIYKVPTHTPPFHLYQYLIRGRVVSSYINADYKFLCGTNALGKNMFRPLPIWNIHLHNAFMLKETVCFGVGLGNNSKDVNLYTRLLYRTCLSRDYFHSTRDEATKLFLESLGYKAISTGCPTLWGLTPALCSKIPRTKSNAVVFTLTSYQPNTLLDKMMVEILQRNYEHLFFWPQTYGDMSYLESLGKYDCKIISPNLLSYDAILEGDLDYVGNRLHGGIRALQHTRRTIIISIDDRAEKMKESNKIPVIARKDIPEKLDSLINGNWSTFIDIDFPAINRWKSQFDF